MSSRSNRSIGNGTFKSKHNEYQKSQFVLTQEIARLEVWDKAAIEKRQLHMAELALKVWSIKA